MGKAFSMYISAPVLKTYFNYNNVINLNKFITLYRF